MTRYLYHVRSYRGDYAFQDCTSLEFVKITSNATNIGTDAFKNLKCCPDTSCGYDSGMEICYCLNERGCFDAESLCGGINGTTLVIPEQITTIYAGFLAECPGLRDKITTVYVPRTVERIGEKAFCASAEKCPPTNNGPRNVETIVFEEGSQLTEV